MKLEEAKKYAKVLKEEHLDESYAGMMRNADRTAASELKNSEAAGAHGSTGFKAANEIQAKRRETGALPTDKAKHSTSCAGESFKQHNSAPEARKYAEEKLRSSNPPPHVTQTYTGPDGSQRQIKHTLVNGEMHSEIKL